MLNDDNVGVTIHKVGEGIDNGGIIVQKKYDKNTEKTVYGYYKKVFSDTPKLIMESLERIDESVEQGMGTYYGLPTKKDYKEFERKGLKII
jgi:methionyl-tRNA formyltransferase